MKHTIEEMATMCEEHAGRVERALLVLHEDAKQKAAWRDEAARLRAAARALREMSEALTEVAQLASAESPIGRIARRALAEGGDGE